MFFDTEGESVQNEKQIGFKYGKGSGNNGGGNSSPAYRGYNSWDDWSWGSYWKRSSYDDHITKKHEEEFRVLKSKMGKFAFDNLVKSVELQNPDFNNLMKNVTQKPLETNLQEGKVFGPSFMAEDIFNLFFTENTFKDITHANSWWKKTIDSFDDYLIKDLTKDNYFFSSIILGNILESLMQMTPQEKNSCDRAQHQSSKEKSENDQKSKEKQESNPNDQDGSEGEGEGEGESKEQNDSSQNNPGQGDGKGKESKPQPQNNFDSKTQSDLDNIAKRLDDAVRKSIKDISNEAVKLKKMGLTPEDMKSPDMINALTQVKEIAAKVDLRKRDVFGFIQKSIKGMKKSITGHTSTFEEDLFESDCPEDLDDFVNLIHPAMMQELFVIEKDPTSKFDIYVDCSGSMSSGCSLGIPRMQAAKAIIMKMRNMGILNNVYPYEGSVKDPFSAKQIGPILKMYAGGGTNGDNCVLNIQKTGIPSMIITDGDDNYSEYSPQAYILCLEQPVGFSKHISDKWIKNKQAVLFRNQKFTYLK
jgi:hypothetical protein